MNLPNKLTLFRLMLVPFCVLFIVLDGVIGEDLGSVIAAVIFAAATIAVCRTELAMFLSRGGAA